jgi:hypothetical protein
LATSSSQPKMAEKDKQDLVMVDIEYAKIHPLAENADDNFRKNITERDETEKERLERIADMFLARPLYSKESLEYQRKMKRKDEDLDRHTSNCLQSKAERVKQDLDVIDIEYAAIHPTDENLKKDIAKRQETEQERLERIAGMFLARPLYSKEIIEYQRKMKRKDERKAGSVKQNLEVIDIEYAAIHPTDENLKGDNPKRQETEQERLHRIADMFLARPANVGDKCKDVNVRITKSDDEVTTKKAMKKNKKKVSFNNMFSVRSY